MGQGAGEVHPRITGELPARNDRPRVGLAPCYRTTTLLPGPQRPQNGPESVSGLYRQGEVAGPKKRLQRPLQAILVGLSALHEGEQRAGCIAGGFPCASTGQMCGDMRIEEIFDFAALFPALDGVD